MLEILSVYVIIGNILHEKFKSKKKNGKKLKKKMDKKVFFSKCDTFYEINDCIENIHVNQTYVFILKKETLCCQRNFSDRF